MAQTTQGRPGADAPIVNRGTNRKAPWPVQFYGTAVGKKWVMALTGVGLIGFVFAHMIGNLKIYLGMTTYHGVRMYDIDAYGESLRQLLVPIMPATVILWLLRIGLIVMFGLHIHSAYSLTRMNQRARPTRYQSSRDYVAVSFASRTMRWTGMITTLYLVFHLFDLSWTGTGATWHRGAVHDNFIASMQRPWAAAIYIVANLAIAVHLYHGTWSMFQSLGLNNPRYNAARRVFATGLSGLIGLGNVLFPIMVLAKVIK